MQLQPNITFDNHYTLIRQLGRGGFSEVWLAHDSYMDLDVALKIYAPGQGMDEHSIDELRREIKVVFTLNHPNLLTPKYLGVWDGMPYLVLAYCSRGSLTQQIGKLPEQELWHVLHDVAAGLAYLHKNDIVHQDIKPDNILIDDSGNYVITDFGISAKARSTLRKSVIGGAVSGGTTAYMGPERFSKQPAPTKASDIWSFGAMMFELVAGNVPFGESGGVIQKSGAEIPDIIEPISGELCKTIESMLVIETWDRPTAEQLAIDKKNNSISSPSRSTQRLVETIPSTTDSGNVQTTLPQKKPNKRWWLLSIVPLLLVGVFFVSKKSPSNVIPVTEPQQEIIEPSLVELIEKGLNNGSIWAEVDIVDKDNLKVGESCKVKVKTSSNMMFLKVRGADAEHTIVGEKVNSYSDLNVGHINEWEEIWKPNAELLEIGVYLWTAEGEYIVNSFRFDVKKTTKQQAKSSQANEKNSSNNKDNIKGVETKNVSFPQGAIKGVFSVSKSKKVAFSKGNLQYQASTNTWRFAEHQYDYIGNANSNISPAYSGWIDLFGWGTGNNPTNSSEDDHDYSTFVDWGVNKISNGGNVLNAWFTLSYDEWKYLLGNRTNAEEKQGVACVNGINGLVLLPDNWTLPSGAHFTSGYADDFDKTVNTYTASEWALMEEAGAVFLPAAGFRDGTSVYYVGDYGDYWSCTEYVTSSVCVYFYSYGVYAYNGSRYGGYSVRLCLKL